MTPIKINDIEDIVNLAENITNELVQLNFVGSLAVPRDTKNCPGKVMRLKLSLDEFSCATVAFLSGSPAS